MANGLPPLVVGSPVGGKYLNQWVTGRELPIATSSRPLQRPLPPGLVFPYWAGP
jgi:hypothetical protein